MNKWLFSILIVLAVLTYYVEEIGGIRQRALQDSREQLFDPDTLGELKSFRTRYANVVKEGNAYFTLEPRYPVSAEKLDLVFKGMAAVKIKRIFPEGDMNAVNEAEFFPAKAEEVEFIFANGNLAFKLGKKLDFDQSFYMQVTNGNKKTWVVAFDPSAEDAPYVGQDHYRSEGKYRKFLTLLLLKDDFFYETKIFHDRKLEPTTVKITNMRNRPFQLKLNPEQTEPPVLNGLNYLKPSFSWLKKDLENLQGRAVYFPVAMKNLQEEVSQVLVETTSGELVTLTLYRKYGSLNGYFLHTSLRDSVYELEQSTSDIFFKNVQDFWDKKIFGIKWDETVTSKNFNIRFSDKDHYRLFIPPGREFKVVYQDGKEAGFEPNYAAFQKLFEFLSKPADRVAEMNKAEAGETVPGAFTLEWDKLSYSVLFNAGELIVADKINKHRLHYLVGKEVPIGLKFEDYFK